VRLRQLDEAGNTGSSLSTFRALTVDLTPPVVSSVTVGGGDRVVSAQASDRRVTAVTSPGQSTVLLVDGEVLGSATADASGLLSYALTAANIEKIGQGGGKTISFADLSGNTALSTSDLFAVDTLSATAVRDGLIGVIGQGDAFAWSTLSQSLLVAYDTVTNYEAADVLRIAGASPGLVLAESVGTIPALNAANIGALLTPSSFAAGSAAAFKVSGVDGTFLAVGNNTPGYQSSGDAVVRLLGYSIDSTNTVRLM